MEFREIGKQLRLSRQRNKFYEFSACSVPKVSERGSYGQILNHVGVYVRVPVRNVAAKIVIVLLDEGYVNF